MQKRELGKHIHEEWKGMTQPVGLVVEPIVLERLGIFPEMNITLIADLQRRLESLVEDHIEGDDFCTAVFSFKEFCKEVLNWEDNDLLKPGEFSLNQNNHSICVVLEDYEEILKPDWIVPEFNEKNNENTIQILVKELETGTPFDQLIKNTDNRKQWEATHQQRFERLLKDTENPIGIIWNGIALRLVYAPRGESSGHITFPIEPMLTVDGRPMISALEMLIGPDRLFEGGSNNLRLRNILEQSRKEQNEVSTRLSEQVLEALWILVRGFDEAETKVKSLGTSIFKNFSENDYSHIYGGLITVLLRLVFLLYSEDEELMPIDSLFVKNYSVTGLAAKLRKDRSQFQSSMEDRHGSWGALLSLFRLVYDGGGPYSNYLPARHGELFDPDAYPFLEGREKDSCYKKETQICIPPVSDDVIEKVLNKLLLLDGQILSYRSLDVEQIGSVYEGIMGFTVERASAPSVGILYKPPKQKISLTFVFNTDEFLAQPILSREKWLREEASVDLKLPATIKKLLNESTSLAEICKSLDKRLSPYTVNGLDKGNLYIQPTLERRRSGSHYTPRVLTEPIVEETFRPWLESYNFAPTAQDILSLKICDPAMGSGAFLVATCRFLANYLVKAWEINEFPPEFDESYDKDIYARRLVSQCCLYGVDKNPFAVSLAKLSLWLITLNKKLPFTFLDHAFKCGDSLIGFSLKEIKEANNQIQLGFLDYKEDFINDLNIDRQKSFSIDSRNDISYDNKRRLLEEHQKKIEFFQEAGNLMVATFFNSKSTKERLSNQEKYLSILNSLSIDGDQKISTNEIFIKFNSFFKKINPFHWDLEFPEVFLEPRSGFDFFIGNPPFAGKNTIAVSYPDKVLDWLKSRHPETHGNSDLVAHFFRRSFNLLKENGYLGLIATNTIYQGDTRSTGLRWICENGGDIFFAKRKVKWPGVAAVVISIIHIKKGKYKGDKMLNGTSVKKITAFLLKNGGNNNPRKLAANSNKSFIGTYVCGKGFIFEDCANSNNVDIGAPSSLSEMENLLEKNPHNSEVIYPLIGCNEINEDPCSIKKRFIINFSNFKEDEARDRWPDLMKIVERKVKPQRMKNKRDGRRKKWWQHGETCPGLYNRISGLEKVLVTGTVTTHFGFPFVTSNYVFTHRLVVFPLEDYAWFACLKSQLHLIFIKFSSSTFGDNPTYSPSDSFETFPFPKALDDSRISNHYLQEKVQLENIGKKYYEFRSDLIFNFKKGLTTLYNEFNDPNVKDSWVMTQREIHVKLDKVVLDSYGWSDISCDCGFGLEDIDIEIDEDELPEGFLKNRILEKNYFFWELNDAVRFESELRAFTRTNKKLSWRYRWPDNVRDELLSRILRLNEERFYEEELSGLSTDIKKSEASNSKRKDKIKLDPGKVEDQIQINLDI